MNVKSYPSLLFSQYIFHKNLTNIIDSAFFECEIVLFLEIWNKLVLAFLFKRNYVICTRVYQEILTIILQSQELMNCIHTVSVKGLARGRRRHFSHISVVILKQMWVVLLISLHETDHSLISCVWKRNNSTQLKTVRLSLFCLKE